MGSVTHSCFDKHSVCINTPRYPSLKGIMGAKKKEIKCISGDLKSDQSQTIESISLPQKSKQTEIIEADA
ncbi:MAG: hypothetical protein CM15mP127_14350 [Gammaproteobacteria bacterium]|nr:MAG: hypothetical protein CM15mP127_14350 [Gammaproteobacteria bacterium]